MTTEQLAEYAGTHALMMFATGAVAMLLLTAACWRWFEHHGEWLQHWVVRTTKRVLHFIDARLLNGRLGTIEPGEYLVLHVVIGFIVMFVTLATFFELTDALAADEELSRFDNALAQTLRSTVTDGTYRFFSWVTRLGDVAVLTVISVIIALVLAWRRRWLLMAGWLTAVAGNGLLTRALKELFQRLRPLHDHGFATAQGWSFPSGHSSGALVVYGMLAYLAIRISDRRWHLPIVMLAIASILTVGGSRIFLQVHYFTDVIAGFCSGAAWLAVCIAGTDLVMRQRHSLR